VLLEVTNQVDYKDRETRVVYSVVESLKSKTSSSRGLNSSNVLRMQRHVLIKQYVIRVIAEFLIDISISRTKIRQVCGARRQSSARTLQSVVYVSHHCRRAHRYIIIEASRCRFGRGRRPAGRPVSRCLSLDPRTRSVCTRARARARMISYSIGSRRTAPHCACTVPCAVPCRAGDQ